MGTRQGIKAELQGRGSEGRHQGEVDLQSELFTLCRIVRSRKKETVSFTCGKSPRGLEPVLHVVGSEGAVAGVREGTGKKVPLERRLK